MNTPPEIEVICWALVIGVLIWAFGPSGCAVSPEWLP
jgi:hypothetical protein